MDREHLDTWFERAILGLVAVMLVLWATGNGAVGPLEFLVLQGLTIAVALKTLSAAFVATFGGSGIFRLRLRQSLRQRCKTGTFAKALTIGQQSKAYEAEGGYQAVGNQCASFVR